MGKNRIFSCHNGSGTTYSFLFAVLAPFLILFNFISLFIPFFQFTKNAKGLFLAGCLLAWCVLFLLFRKFIENQKPSTVARFIDEAKQHFARHALIAAALTVLANSLTRFYQPGILTMLDSNAPAADSSGFFFIYLTWAFVYPAARALLIFLFYFFSSVCIQLRSSDAKDYAIQYILLFFLSFFFINSLNYRNELINNTSHNLAISAAAFLVFALIPVGISALHRKFPDAQPWILLAVIAVAAAFQVIYIQSLPNTQTSDFWDFNRAAMKLAAGESGLSINKYAAFTRLLSMFYRLHPGAATAKAINLVLTVLSMAGLYCIGKETGHSRAGIIAAYLFGMLPSQSGMVIIVNNDIPALTFFILGMVFLIQFLNGAKWHKLAVGAFFFGAALSIRSSMVIYAPLLILAFLRNVKPGWKKISKTAAALILGIMLGLFSIKAAITSARVDGMRVDESRNVMFPLLNGTNIAYEGRVNYQDSGLVNSWSGAEIWQKGLPIVLDRIFSDPAAFFQLLRVKYSYLFGDATYVADYVFNFENKDHKRIESTWRYGVDEVHFWFAQFSQYCYWVLLGVSLAFIFHYHPSLKKVAWIGALVFLCAVGAYAFFEVQPRYNRPLIPFLALFAAIVLSSGKTNNEHPV